MNEEMVRDVAMVMCDDHWWRIAAVSQPRPLSLGPQRTVYLSGLVLPAGEWV